jgi:hypothetical protein
MNEPNDTKLCWTDADLAETEQTGYGRGYAEALEQLEQQLRIWQRPSALNFTREVRRLIEIIRPAANPNGSTFDQGVRAERMRTKRIINRHLLPGGQLIWHMMREMTKQEFEQLIEDGQG